MKRIAAALLVMGVLVQGAAAFVPHDKEQIRFGLNLPAPVSQAAAERTAEAFIRQRLDYPPNTEFTFLPAIRAYLSGPAAGMRPSAAVWMCGTVRVGSTANTATWLVAFDWKRPDLVHDGGITRFTPGWCSEIYRDGLRVFGNDGVTVLQPGR